MIKKGRIYRFDPPIEATGAWVNGDEKITYPGITFHIGLCIENLGYTYEFISQVGGHRYTVCLHPEKYGCKVVEIGEPTNE